MDQDDQSWGGRSDHKNGSNVLSSLKAVSVAVKGAWIAPAPGQQSNVSNVSNAHICKKLPLQWPLGIRKDKTKSSSVLFAVSQQTQGNINLEIWHMAENLDLKKRKTNRDFF